jgi:hypothetical protein
MLAFLAEDVAIALLPIDVVIDIGYTFSVALAKPSNSMVAGELFEQLPTLSRPARKADVHSHLDCITRHWKAIGDRVVRADNGIMGLINVSLPLLFVGHNVRDDYGEVALAVQTTLSNPIAIDVIPSVPPLTNELCVSETRDGNIAVRLSKYFGVHEVLSPGFMFLDRFDALDIVVVMHDGFNENIADEIDPTILAKKVITGTVRRGTISTLSPDDTGDHVRPSDLYYPSNAHKFSPEVEATLKYLCTSVRRKLLEENGLEDEIGLLTTTNIIRLILSSESSTRIGDMFKYADSTARLSDISEEQIVLFSAYARVFATLERYVNEKIPTAMNTYLANTVMSGPNPNNGSAVYPIYRSLNLSSVIMDDVPGRTKFMRIFANYPAVHVASAVGQGVTMIDHPEVTFNLTAVQNLGRTKLDFSAELTKSVSYCGLASGYDEMRIAGNTVGRAAGPKTLPNWIPTTETPALPRAWASLVIDPFRCDRTGRSFEAHIHHSDFTAFYDQVPSIATVHTKALLPATEALLRINAQWPGRDDVCVVQGSVAELGAREFYVILSNVDYDIHPDSAALLFFLQTRNTSINRGFTWRVARYLGYVAARSAKIPNVEVDTATHIFRAVENVGDINGWLPAEKWPVLCSASDSAVPTHSVRLFSNTGHGKLQA